MSELIWTWDLHIGKGPKHVHELSMLFGTEIVHVEWNDLGNGAVSIWGKASASEKEHETRRFVIRATGSPSPKGSIYAGTCVAPGSDGWNRFVWHVFEVDA